MNKEWVSVSSHPCPSCAALDGQVHSEETWAQVGLKPKDHSLMCKEKCTCSLNETDKDEQGDLTDIPLRLGETDMNTNKDITFKLSAAPTEEGFDILAIDEGIAKGHGITFSALVLQEAVPMYEAKPVFIDHVGIGEAQSVRNLAGTLQATSWNEARRGVQAKLIPSGPSAGVLLSLRDAAKNNPAIMEAVGFSTVLNVQLNSKGEVLKIVRIKSVDVVIDPARGGKFLSVPVKPLTKGGQMNRKVKVKVTNPETNEVSEVTGEEVVSSLQEQKIEANHQAAAVLLGETQRQQEEEARLQASEKTLVAISDHLLTVGLSTSRLPEPMQVELREQFKGKAFEPTELTEAIKRKRDVLTALTAGDNIKGSQRISMGYTGAEEFELAVADMFGLPREAGQEKIKVRPLQGIQDAYMQATGDQYFMGGYHPEFALVTANFPGIVANVQNKMLIKAWADFEDHYGWWQKIVTIEHFSNLNTATWIRTGTIASLPTVAERGEYAELAIGDIKETSEWGKYGGYVPLTIEAVLRDDLRAFTRMPREVALAGMRNISEQIAAIFTQASGAGPTMTDTGALFNATAQTTAGGHINLLTTALGADYVAWNAVALAMFNKKLMVKNATGYYGTGKPQALWPSIILVPAALRAQAEALFLPRWQSQAQNVATVSPSWGGRVEVVTVPDWTDATDWAAVIDPRLRQGIMLGEIFGVKPQIYSASSELDPAMFANDESRLKVRQFITVGVADDMPLHKSNVAG